MGKGSLRNKYTVKLGEKSKPLLVPPFPFNLGTLNCYLFIRYLDCWVYVDTYKMMTMMMIKTQNSHKSTNFEAITSRFCMIIDINDTYGLYFHAKT